ncbi:MAG: M56 family metallopeptidase [Acidobacteriota bacterium]
MSPLGQALSAALIHFFWQGALGGALLWVALGVLRHRSAHVRYLVSCGALIAVVILPVATAAAFILRAVPFGDRAVSMVTDLHTLVAPQPMLSIWMNPEASSGPWLTQLQLWALPLWSVGVLLFSVRLMWAAAHAFALGRTTTPADGPIVALVEAVGRRLGIGRAVGVRMSNLTDGPSTLGWLRPIILLTPATAMGLTPSELEAVIAHELAHVKRCDYLVNVCQVLAETIFFYHPAVWWISSRIRFERELCCDDLAVRSCGDPLCYARALTTLERQRVTTPALALAAAGGPLLYRIQRLLGVSTREYGPSRWPIVLAVGMVLTCAALNLSWNRLLAQATPVLPQFEVASVKPNTRHDGFVTVGSRGGQYTALGVSLRTLIRLAYQVQEFQIIGGAGWLDSDRFDVVAKDGSDASGLFATELAPTKASLMIRALLAERFKLIVHKETKQMPVYALVLARSDRRLGPGLRPAAGDCAAPDDTRRPGGEAASPGAAGHGGLSCGISVGPGIIIAGGQPMARLATAFSNLTNTGMSLNRIVVDQTGLTGAFDAELRFTPDRIPALEPGDPGAAIRGGQPIDPNGASLFTAVQEQLGLKLDPRRGPVDVLVVDRAEQPTADAEN